MGRDALRGGRQLVERARYLAALFLGHLDRAGITAVLAVAKPRSEPRRDRPRDRGDDLRRGFLLLDRLALLGLLVALAARDFPLHRVVRHVVRLRVCGRRIAGLGGVRSPRTALDCTCPGGPSSWSGARRGAPSGSQGTSGAQLLGRVRLKLRALLRDIGTGRGMNLPEQQAELVGPHAAHLREPRLGLGRGDAGHLLLRLGSGSAAARRTRRRVLGGDHREGIGFCHRPVGMVIVGLRRVIVLKRSGVRGAVPVGRGLVPLRTTGVAGARVARVRRVVVLLVELRLIHVGLMRIALVECIGGRLVRAQPDRCGMPSRNQMGRAIGFTLELVARSDALAAPSLLLHDVRQLVCDQPVAPRRSRLVGAGTEVHFAALRDRLGRSCGRRARGNHRHARDIEREQPAHPSAKVALERRHPILPLRRLHRIHRLHHRARSR